MPTPHTAQKIEQWPLARLRPYERNARTHGPEQVAQIAASIQEFGFTNPILVGEDDGIIAGHGRLAAAMDLGLTEVPVIVLGHLTAEQRRAYVLADNQLALNAGWDMELLATELQELQLAEFDLSLLGWSDEELADLMPDVEELPPEDADADAVPEPPVDPLTQPGDVWLLGKHRVMCGDSTVITDVERLMDGGKADLVFTDPPYNIASENKGVAANVSQAHEKLMASEWDMDFCFEDVQACLLASIAPSATVYVCTSHHLAASIWTWMKTWSDHNNWCTWSKPNPMPSLMKRHWTWNAELICYATRGKHVFNFPDEGHALSTWTIAKVNGQSGHPTEKLVAVPEHAITHSSKKGQMVLDLFGGSGSTLIACEKTGRQSRLMELDPRYCDVIVNRWQASTGKTATLESTGKSFPVAE